VRFDAVEIFRRLVDRALKAREPSLEMLGHGRAERHVLVELDLLLKLVLHVVLIELRQPEFTAFSAESESRGQ
jgi:hypothetical protein